jgi:hypothetical protein
MPTVVVAADSGTGALACVRALRAAGYEPVVACVDAHAYAARSRAAAGVVVAPSFPEAVERAAAALVLPAGEAPLRALGGRPPDAPVEHAAESGDVHVCGLAWAGGVVCACHQKVIRTWRPGVGSPSYSITVAPDEELERGARSLVAASAWSGPFEARFAGASLCGAAFWISSGTALAIAAGHDIPALWAGLINGESAPEPAAYRTGVALRVEEDDLRALWSSWRDGNRAAALRGLLPRPRTAHAVASLRDPAPLLTTLEKLRRAS